MNYKKKKKDILPKWKNKVKTLRLSHNSENRQEKDCSVTCTRITDMCIYINSRPKVTSTIIHGHACVPCLPSFCSSCDFFVK